MTASNLQYTLSEQQMDVFIKSLTTLLAGYLIAMIVIVLLVAALMIAAGWRVFTKAGQKGWKVLIPFYGDYIFYKIAWKTKYFFIMIACLLAGDTLINMADMAPDLTVIMVILGAILLLIAVILEIMSTVRLAKAFRKRSGFAVGLILLPVVFLPILAFGPAKYRKRKRRRKKNVQPALPA